MQALKGSVHTLVYEAGFMALTSQEATQEVIDTYTADMSPRFAEQLNQAISKQAEKVRRRLESKGLGHLMNEQIYG